MNLADMSIKRPIFISCIVVVMLAVGYLSMQKLGVDLFPDVTFPIVVVTTPYPGAGPSEIETLVSKPLEDEVSTISGLKRLRSINQEGVSTVIAEFTLETDVKYAEQQIRDRVSGAKRNLPDDIDEPVIRRVDPSEQPVLILSVDGKLSPPALYDLANEVIRPRLEQAPQVGLVEVIGGRKREIRVYLDRDKLKAHEISATQVATRLASAGENIPAGKVDEGKRETVFRTLGQFRTVKEIEQTIVNFFGSDVPTTVADVGKVSDELRDEKSRTYVNGQKGLFLMLFRQSGANTIAVVDGVKKKIDALNQELAARPEKAKISIVRDSSWWVRANVEDVKESIMMGIALAVIVVFLFLGNGRSTIITGLALPNSLIGAFILMAAAGFTINIMTLLALSLTVGLLIDDAIVVRENIFRHIEKGSPPLKAASEGTEEVKLAVIATTLTVIAVFGPIAFLKGVVGQFFKQFGATICFAMMISLFDALTVAPMLSAYFAGATHRSKEGIWAKTVGRVLDKFNRFQDNLEDKYQQLLRLVLQRPKTALGISTLVFLASCSAVRAVPKTFLPPQEAGEFSVSLDLPPGTSLDSMDALSMKIDSIIRENKEVEITALTVGGREGESNVADFYVKLVPAKQRKTSTSDVKERIREQLKPFANANPKVKDYDPVAAGQRPFNLNIIGFDQAVLTDYATKVYQWLNQHPGLKDVDVNYRPGKPEFQIDPDLRKMERLGVTSVALGQELRTQIEGVTPAKFRENDVEYEVRVRMAEEQRNLKADFSKIFIPNINNNLVRLSDVAKGVDTQGPAKIYRQDRARYIQISSDITPGYGMADIMGEITKKLTSDPELKLPAGIQYGFIGQAENMQELGESMVLALGFGALFIFLVLASLYESFVTPFTIMLALPLAMCGSFVALWITRESLNIFSMIGGILLLGVATKNSILLVDYANQLIAKGSSRYDAILTSGKTRLRPILMTTMALIAGTIPVALGLNEASRQRTSMGVAIIGGLISSTMLTLIVVPAAYTYVDRFRVWSKEKLKRLVAPKNGGPKLAA